MPERGDSHTSAIIGSDTTALFDRAGRRHSRRRAAHVARTVNNAMVVAYWLIGREIVQELQGGEGRYRAHNNPKPYIKHYW